MNDDKQETFSLTLGKSIQIDKTILQLRNKQQHYQRYELKKMMVFGRDSFCDVVFSHHTISKQHARIYFENGWYIEDLESKNGIYVNHQRVEKIALQMGDLISFVGFDCYFCEVFLYMVEPQATTLSPFHTIEAMVLPKNEKQLCLIEEVTMPQLQLPQKKAASFSVFRDFLLPLVYPLVFIQERGMSTYLYVTILTFLLRLIEKIVIVLQDFLKKHQAKKLYTQQLNDYQRYLETRFMGPSELVKNYFVTEFKEVYVRLGMQGKTVICHDFEKYRCLAIIGPKEKSMQLLVWIIYQIERYYPWIHVEMKDVTYPFILSTSRRNKGRQTLKVDLEGGDFQIVLLEKLQPTEKCYDALLEIEEGWYYSTHKISIQVDRCEDLYLCAKNFSKWTFHQSAPSFEKAAELNRLSVIQLRHQSFISSSLKGILGYDSNQIQYLDLHEQKQGPHLLVAGMTGSGKSEWLTTYLLSLALFYDSDDVQFFLIDFKGGMLCSLFEKLHHTCMCLSNLDEYQMYRAIAALEDELANRERLLLRLSRELNEPIQDIHALKKYADYAHYLAHLLIVVDEFAELKSLYPEIMQALVRIARTGRSLGIHLILCTQRPSGIIDRQTESNIQTKVCLKTASKQDSFDVLGNDHAFHLENAGMYICQVGKDEIKGSTIWSQPISSPLVFYDLQFQELFKLALPMTNSSSKVTYIEKINLHTKKVKPLFVKRIEDVKIGEEYFGIYDDYKHRQMVHFVCQEPLLVMGGYIEDLKDVKGVIQKRVGERVYTKDIEQAAMVLFFESQSLYQLLGKKVPFEINKKKRLGALYKKGEIFQCRIRFAVM